MRRRRRERYEWTAQVQVTPVVVAVNTLSNQVLLTAGNLEEWPGGRLARVIGQLFISPATAPAAATGYGVFFGFTWSEVGATGTQTYDPETELDHRWIHWDSCFPQIGGTAVADSNASRWVGYFRFNFDIRRAGRYRSDQFLGLEVKNSNFSGASIQFSYALRFLLQAGAR